MLSVVSCRLSRTPHGRGRLCGTGWLLLSVLSSCSSDDGGNGYEPVPQPLDAPFLFEENVPPPVIPADNPQTEEGVALGQKLFFEPLLSVDGTVSCASCHLPENAFSDPRQFSLGVGGTEGTRNAMPLHNLAWNYGEDFFWDGRAKSLEDQALEPIVNPLEMKNTWENAVASLQNDPAYPDMFEKAFGTAAIDSVLVAKAIAQFVRTLISANSRFDRHLMGELTLTDAELRGLNVFMSEDLGDCFHCHGNPANPLWTDNTFHNNGLDEFFDDPGLGGVTGDPRDNGKFKAPSLRNLAFTAPYMHDGRFATLEEVIDHYSEGLVYSETIDPLMKAVAQGGVQLSESDKADLKAFLLSLSDTTFVENPDLQNPD